MAEKYPADKDGTVDVLIWITATFQSAPEAGKAANLIIKDHITDKKVDNLLSRLSHSPSAVADKLMTAAAEKNTDPERRFLARFRLAQYLKNKAETITFIASADAKTKPMIEAFLGKDYLAKLVALEPAKLTGEAETLLEALSKDPTDAKVSGRSIKEQIETELFEMKYLQYRQEGPGDRGRRPRRQEVQAQRVPREGGGH